MTWFDVLDAVRQEAQKGEFTSRGVGSRAGIATSVASAWLSKFVKWEYVRIAGTAMGSRRWERTYTITQYGADRPKPKALPMAWRKKRIKRPQYRGGRTRVR